MNVRLVHSSPVARRAGNVVPLRRRRDRRWTWREWLAITLSLFLGIAIGAGLREVDPAPPPLARHGAMAPAARPAAGALPDQTLKPSRPAPPAHVRAAARRRGAGP